jgi:hypothetical protein
MAANAFVDYYPHVEYIDSNGVRGSLPVTGATHKGAAFAINWLRGRGHSLVVAGPSSLLFADGDTLTYTFRFWIKPDDLHITRVLCMTVSAGGLDYSAATFSGTVELPAASGNLFPFACQGSPVPLLFAYDTPAATNTAQEFSFTISSATYAPTSGMFLQIHGVHVFECPLNLIDGNSLSAGIDVRSLDPRSPIYNGASLSQSVDAIANQLPSAKTQTHRRGALFNYCAPLTVIGHYDPGTPGNPGGPGNPGRPPLPFLEAVYTSGTPTNSTTDYPAYVTFLNNPLLWGSDYLPSDTWANMEGATALFNAWAAWGTAHPTLGYLLGVPMFPDDIGEMNLQTAASGAYLSHFTTLAQNLAAAGTKRVIIRLAPEFQELQNIGDLIGNEGFFRAYWVQIVNTMRANAGSMDIKFCWNPYLGGGVDLVACWPGPSYVDYVGVDIYDWFGAGYVANTTPSNTARETAWQSYLTGNGSPYGLNWFVQHALTMNKPLIVPSWGVQAVSPDAPAGGDNPLFVQHMFNWAAANNIYMMGLQDDGVKFQLWPEANNSYVTPLPLAKAMYLDLFSGPTAGTPGTLPFQAAAYTNPAPQGLTDWPLYCNYLSNPNMYGYAYCDTQQWSDVETPDWMLGPWGDWQTAHPTLPLLLGVPMLLQSGTSYATGATGAYNFHYATLADRIEANNLKHVIVRLGWEFNLQPVPSAADFRNYWAQIVNTMRGALPPGFDIKFMYNPLVERNIDLIACYPGDAYVDLIGVDRHDHYGSGYVANVQPSAAIQAQAWAGYLNGNGTPWGLNWFADFARLHSKPLCVPEWGCWAIGGGIPAGGDDPSFVQNMYDWMVANNVIFEGYFDSDQGQMWPGANGSFVTPIPLSKAKYLQLFSGGASSGSSAGTAPSTTVSTFSYGFSTTSSTFVNIFAVPPAMQTRSLTNGQTSAQVRGNVYGKVAGGLGGQVRCTMASGAVVTWNVSNSAGAWSGEQVFSVECDDPGGWSTNAGIRGGTRDEAVWQFKAPAGGTIWIQSINVNDFPV